MAEKKAAEKVAAEKAAAEKAAEEQAAAERHNFLCRSVCVASRLIGEAGSVRTVRTLVCLCA